MTENYEKDFVPKKLALALKKLGFDEPCLMAYLGKEKEPYLECDDVRHLQAKDVLNPLKTPTYSQAFRWFREEHGLRNTITDFIDDKIGIEWDYEIAIIGTDLDERGNYKPLVAYSTDDETRKFKTYEEAESACLIKLIEIVKNTQI
jgi:hypothetical protein